MNFESINPDPNKPFEGVPFSRVVMAGVGHAILRSAISIILYLVAGLPGLVLSWLYGISLGRRSRMIGFPKATSAMASIGTATHAAVSIWTYILLSLSVAPPWWP